MNKQEQFVDEREDSLVAVSLDAAQLPEIISGQVDKLNELDASIKAAIKAADNAESRAKNAYSQSAGFGQKKAAIEVLQSAGLEIATAIQSGAKAQKVSFEFQTKLAEITKYLFALGVSNIAANRFVVRELELRLKGASEEELSELARQELMSVVRQLKEQEDILKRQQENSTILKDHDGKLQQATSKLSEVEVVLRDHKDLHNAHESRIGEHSESIKNHAKRLVVIQHQTSENEKQAEFLLSIIRTKESEELARDEAIGSINNSIATLRTELEEMKTRYSKRIRFWSRISAIVSGLSIAIAGLVYFLK